VTPPQVVAADAPADRWRSRLSLAALTLALALLAATYLLMSPPPGGAYPGASPWRPGSPLRGIVDLMALRGAAATARGVEIKDFAFQLASAAALLLLALRACVSGLLPPEHHTAKGAWFYAQAFLSLWVVAALTSAAWSQDAAAALGQGAIYGLALAWAVALSWCLESRDVPRLLAGYVVVAALGAALSIWYFYERNPEHRPGFPIGNPNSLAACTLPALLIAVSLLAGRVWNAATRRTFEGWPAALAAAAALVPLLWCFGLTDSRGANLGLAVGLACGGALLSGRRLRWALGAGLLLALLLGALYFYVARQDLAMARSQTVRFRLYAWTYATVLWNYRPVSGLGAGAYPRHAGALSVSDRALDPAPFMAELVEHAHNELFEVFAEIGLVFGVTFVAGYVATMVAAAALLRANLSDPRRWLLLGLIAAVIGLLADAMFGVGLRLPGLPAVHYTLLGVLWAECRSMSRRQPGLGERSIGLRGLALRRAGVAAAALLLAGGAGWLALRNWRGALDEQAANQALQADRFEAAVDSAQSAEARLLDPVRKLLAHEMITRARFERARAAFQQYSQRTGQAAGQPTSAEADAARQAAMDRGQEAYEATRELIARAPAYGFLHSQAAEAAKWVADACRSVSPERWREWLGRAFQAWREQWARRPYDVRTLLALTRYPISVEGYVGLLRDALRAGFPSSEWDDALRRGAQRAGFEPTLVRLLLAVGPYNPESNLDSLVISMAPEMWRLSAIWHARHFNFAPAINGAARAAELYQPMRRRFPELYSVALAERADYVFGAAPETPELAVSLLQEALAALPRVSSEKFNESARPFRIRLAKYQLAAGQEEPATQTLREIVVDDPARIEAFKADLYVDLAQSLFSAPGDTRQHAGKWLDAARQHSPRHRGAWGAEARLAARTGGADAAMAVLEEARAAGLTGEDLEAIRLNLCDQFPDLRERLRAGD